MYLNGIVELIALMENVFDDAKATIDLLFRRIASVPFEFCHWHIIERMTGNAGEAMPSR